MVEESRTTYHKPYTITADTQLYKKHRLVFIDSTANAVSVVLAKASELRNTYVTIVHIAGSNPAYIASFENETIIPTGSPIELLKNDSITYHSDGTKYRRAQTGSRTDTELLPQIVLGTPVIEYYYNAEIRKQMAFVTIPYTNAFPEITETHVTAQGADGYLYDTGNQPIGTGGFLSFDMDRRELVYTDRLYFQSIGSGGFTNPLIVGVGAANRTVNVAVTIAARIEGPNVSALGASVTYSDVGVGAESVRHFQLNASWTNASALGDFDLVDHLEPVAVYDGEEYEYILGSQSKNDVGFGPTTPPWPVQAITRVITITVYSVDVDGKRFASAPSTTVTVSPYGSSAQPTGVTASVLTTYSEAGDQLYAFQGSWTNPVSPNFAYVEVVAYLGTQPERPLGQDVSSFLTDSWSVNGQTNNWILKFFAVNKQGIRNIVAVPQVALTVAPILGSSGQEYAPYITSPGATVVYTVDDIGSRSYQLDIGWTNPTDLSRFRGVQIVIRRASGNPVLLEQVTHSVTAFKSQPLPVPAVTADTFDVVFLSVDANNRANPIVAGTPYVTVTVQDDLQPRLAIARAKVSEIASHLEVASGVFKIKAEGITGALVANFAIGNNKLDRVSADKIAINNADIVNLAAAKITAGTLAAGVFYGGQVNAVQINAGTLNSGVVYTGQVSANQIQAGTVSVAITLTAPTIVISNPPVTVNIDAINYVSVQHSSSNRRTVHGHSTFRIDQISDSNQFTQMSLYTVAGQRPGTASFNLTCSSSGSLTLSDSFGTPKVTLDTVNGVTLPSQLLPSAATGRIAIDSTDGNKLKWHNGISWQTAGSSGSGGHVMYIKNAGVFYAYPQRPGLAFEGSAIFMQDDPTNQVTLLGFYITPSGSSYVVGNNRSVLAGGMLTGGGNLGADVTLTMNFTYNTSDPAGGMTDGHTAFWWDGSTMWWVYKKNGNKFRVAMPSY